MVGKLVGLLPFAAALLLNFSQISWASPSDVQLNSYTIFDVKQLSRGKDVTVGKYVLAYIPLGENITIQAANPPQRIDVRLQWRNSKENHQKLKILGEWSQARHQLSIGVNLGRKLQASRAPISHAGEKGGTLIKGNIPNLLSLPLMADHPVSVFADKSKFRGFSHKIRVVVSSNKAFVIKR